MAEQITLYTAKVCPYAHRAEIALAELGIEHTKYQIDLQNKPEWYAPKVNPASKVPAITYGGPIVPPDEPSPESEKIAESLVLLEFFADLKPDSTFLPKDAISRAKVRFFIDAISNKLSPAQNAFLRKGESPEALYKAFDYVQSLLPDNTKYAVSDNFTTADAAIAPFFARGGLALKNDFGAYKPGEGTKVLETLKSPKYAKLWGYWEAVLERPSVKSTLDEEYLINLYKHRYQALREEKQKAL
ncbi:glutathione S-transferase [Rickenella mellea]|uniref:Glutathione S-transferase n=1 Tax=Rickenella mellea TaxID=50990 RepID=A0A4Y7QA78_9AGAM|nr:glutathione S-transferase [Rickenella mellea]